MSNLRLIRERRLSESKRFSQEECAKVIGVSMPTYRKLEKHPENLTKAQSTALADHLGCAEEDIFLRVNRN